jgi:hypothetical protein
VHGVVQIGYFRVKRALALVVDDFGSWPDPATSRTAERPRGDEDALGRRPAFASPRRALVHDHRDDSARTTGQDEQGRRVGRTGRRFAGEDLLPDIQPDCLPDPDVEDADDRADLGRESPTRPATWAGRIEEYLAAMLEHQAARTGSRPTR